MKEKVFTMGVDIGSTTSKCVILEKGSRVAGSSLILSGTGTSGPDRAIAAALEEAGLSREDIYAVAATGYGRNSMEDADFVVSELSCHAKGAVALFPKARTVVDIGGQDAKAMRIDNQGYMESFIMNDKCAAGTGRFLDVMARILELDVSQLGDEDAKATAPVTISSTCTVFAESEVISQLSKGTPIPDIVAGVHESVAKRTTSLVKRLGLWEPIVMTGGVSQNSGIVRALERELDAKVHTLPMAQLAGAYGAALHAWERAR